MDAVATYQSVGRTLDGDLTITFVVENDPILIEHMEALKGQELLLEVSKHSNKHSGRARRYMWKLCDLIAKKLGSDKDTIYLMMLRDAGVFEYLEIPQVEVGRIEPFYRYVEEIGTHDLYQMDVDGNERTIVISELRCYHGMHDYTTKELSDLINKIVDTCNLLKVPTITEDEFRRLAGL